MLVPAYGLDVARRARSLLTDGVFHVTARATGGDVLFRDDLDRNLFVVQLTRTEVAFEWTCHVYCLMTTHYHLLVEASREALSRGMHRLNGNYAQGFNARHGRRGHLFEGRFSAYVVEGGEYFEKACLYVLNNPVRAGLSNCAEDWPWSGGPVVRRRVSSSHASSVVAAP